MRVSDVQELYDYNEWATDRILAQARKLTPEEWTANVLTDYGSLRATLVHTLDTEWGWRNIVQHGSSAGDLDEADFTSVDALAERWAQDRAEMRDYLASLTDAVLRDVARYSVDGHAREVVLWHVLLHVFNHSTQHRSEAAAILTALGHSPGDLDLIWYFYYWRKQAG